MLYRLLRLKATAGGTPRTECESTVHVRTCVCVCCLQSVAELNSQEEELAKAPHEHYSECLARDCCLRLCRRRWVLLVHEEFFEVGCCILDFVCDCH